jgi:cation diffusion facilitator family transporter
MNTHDHDHNHKGHTHGQANVDRALEASREGVRALKISMAALAATALVQAGVVVASGSVALLSDTLHNLSDAGTALPLLLAFRLSRRRPSARFSYGLGRTEDLAGIFIVAMIAASAVLAGWQAISHLRNPVPIEHLGLVAAAAVIGALGNEAVALYRIRVGRRIGSAALVADGLHARTDALTSLAVLAGAAGVALGWEWADPAVGLVIAAVIVVVLVQAVRGVGERLLDGVDPTVLERARGTAASVAGVENVDEVRARWIGHRLHAEVRMTVDRDLDVAAAHHIADDVEQALIHELPELDAAVIHVNPCSHEASRV